MSTGLIRSYHERYARAEQKRMMILEFLKNETYTNAENIMRLLGVKSHKSFYPLVNKMEAMHLIKKSAMNTYIGDYSLWGITRSGIAQVLQREDASVPPWFQISKVSAWSMFHHLDKQKARLILESKGCQFWENCDRGEFASEYQKRKHRPDGIITLPSGLKVAIEVERKIKSPKRYSSIMAEHLIQRSKNSWHYIYYVLPDEITRKRLEKIFNEITVVTANSSPVTITEQHRRIFRFFTMDELECLQLEQGSGN